MQDTGEKSGALDLGCELAQLTNSKLSVVVISEEPYPLIGSEMFSKMKMLISDKRQECQLDIDINLYDDNALDAVLFESRFADLLILARDPLPLHATEYIPSTFVKKILCEAECPIILAPRSLMAIEEIAFCYNGSSSCIFAIKQFSYLLPQFCTKRLRLVEIRDFELNPQDRAKWLLYHKRTREWLETHYVNFDFTFIEGEVAVQLSNYMATKKNQLAVMGSYGRSTLSTMLKKSVGNSLIANVDLPVFIAHK